MFKKTTLLLAALIIHLVCLGQEKLPLKDLSGFKNPAGNWSIVGDANADIVEKNSLNTTPGTGVLACSHKQGTYGPQYELVSDFEHGDLDIEFDFMMAKESNSGIYMQGNYEIQLYDSWGKKNVKYDDCGGLYERWDESRPTGQKGYEGTAPRVNASKAPGLWQHMRISFQAPRFDAAGNKIANAKVISLYLNGMILHENVELSGVTRGALTQKEVAKGPLRFQGDHGSLAFRNIVISNFDKPAASLKNLTYEANYQAYDPSKNAFTLPAEEKGTLEGLTWEFLKQPNEYSFKILGDLEAPNSGIYYFTLYSSSNNLLKIDGKEVIPNQYTGSNDARTGSVELTKGTHKLEFQNAKYDGWMQPALGLYISGPGFRETPMHAMSSMIGNKASDPIMVEANTNTVLRSFMDFKKGDDQTRIVHAVSVGTPQNIHYTYDLDKGAILQVWRGKFLNTTPMWNDRGDGSSRPMGSITLLNHDLLFSQNNNANWAKDTTGSSYRPMGYKLDENDLPEFHYKVFGMDIKDKMTPVEGKMFSRSILLDGTKKLTARLAEGKSIEKISENLYAIDDKSYYIQTDGKANLSIRNTNGSQELIANDFGQNLNYSIIF